MTKKTVTLVAAVCVVNGALGSQFAYAGSFQTYLVSVSGTMQMNSGTGGPPPLPIPTSSFGDSGGFINFGSGGSNAGSAVYGTVTYNVKWVPASGKTVQQDPPPATYTLTANVSAGASTTSGVWHPQSYAATYDGFPTDLQNNPPYPGNPLDPWYYQSNTGTYYISPIPLTLWNFTQPGTPVYTAHTFTNAYPSAPIAFNFDSACPADADNNTASWDPNPARHAGAAWPCYTLGNNGPGEGASFYIQVSVI